MNVDIILHFKIMSHQNVSMLIGESQALQGKLVKAHTCNLVKGKTVKREIRPTIFSKSYFNFLN
jgi:hypothetical protein